MNRRHFSKILVSTFAGGTPGFLSGPASAQLVNKLAYDLKNGEFNWFPERSPGSGPLLIIVSIPEQLVHVYRNGVRVAASTCSTGKSGHETPTGVFTILQKDKHHKSSTYNNAPMPNMNRLTWSGIALHAGKLPGYPASHGCVRLPLQFSELLFGITKLGMTVVLADNKTQPKSVVHPGMVLGDHAKREFLGVNASILKSQYGAASAEKQKTVSVVVSGKDRKAVVWEDDKIVAKGNVDIEDSVRPLKEGLHSLIASHPEKQEIEWHSIGYGKTDREDLSKELRRIKAEPGLREEIRKRMHHGMRIVTTHESLSESHQSSPDFVVIDGLY